MNENKISVSEYLKDNNKLEVNYIPYDVKLDIVDVVLSQVISNDGMPKVDSALLKRVSTEVFIETITNIDMSIKSEFDLGGYDELCLNNGLDFLIEFIEDEFDRFNEILDSKLNDFYRYNNSTGSVLMSLKNSLVKFINKKTNEVNELINTIDTKDISNRLKKLIEENMEKYRGK